MKKIPILLVCAMFLLSSCATLFGGRRDSCQETKPAPGQPARSIRLGWTIADIAFVPVLAYSTINADRVRHGVVWGMAGISVGIDFGTNKIYRKCHQIKVVKP